MDTLNQYDFFEDMLKRNLTDIEISGLFAALFLDFNAISNNDAKNNFLKVLIELGKELQVHIQKSS